MYTLIRPVLFLFDPERIHYFSMRLLHLLVKSPFRFLLSSPTLSDTSLERKLFGLTFRNPVGLAAGFDKNAQWLDALEALGFGFVEIGTVTPLPQEGNPKPRLFRLPADKALINRMGFNNKGLAVVCENLRNYKLRNESTPKRLIVGGNIGKNKSTPNEEAWKDYLICFQQLFDWVDYFVVNVSSPNTPDLRALQEKEAISKILHVLAEENNKRQTPKPILLKIAPDLSHAQIDDIAEVITELRIEGVVIANTTISRNGLSTSVKKIDRIGNGGVSGKPLQQASTELIRYFRDKTGDQIPIIGSGGIFSGKDAEEKISNGAALVQIWTGLVYEGPSIVKKICNHLRTS